MLERFPKKKQYVAYCRGPYCIYADRAVELLRAHGRKAHRLAVGFPEWRAAGLPVETSQRPVIYRELHLDRRRIDRHKGQRRPLD